MTARLRGFFRQLRNTFRLLDKPLSISFMGFPRFLALPLLTTIASCALYAQQTEKPAAAEEPAPQKPEEKISFNYIHNDGQCIAMTFDDGPSKKLTPKLL